MAGNYPEAKIKSFFIIWFSRQISVDQNKCFFFFVYEGLLQEYYSEFNSVVFSSQFLFFGTIVLLIGLD